MINTMFQTSMGDFYFDAVFKTEHHAGTKVTEHPVQIGAAISDHAYREPDELMLEIGMTDVNGDGNSANMFKQLKALMLTQEPFTVVTRLDTYENMLITSLSAPDDYTTMFAFKASLVLKQVRVVSVAVMQVQQTVSGSQNPSAQSSSSGSSSGSSSTPSSSTSSSQPAAQQEQTVAETKPSGEETKAALLQELAKATTNEKIVASAKAKTATPVITTKATLPASPIIVKKTDDIMRVDLETYLSRKP